MVGAQLYVEIFFKLELKGARMWNVKNYLRAIKWMFACRIKHTKEYVRIFYFTIKRTLSRVISCTFWEVFEISYYGTPANGCFSNNVIKRSCFTATLKQIIHSLDYFILYYKMNPWQRSFSRSFSLETSCTMVSYRVIKTYLVPSWTFMMALFCKNVNGFNGLWS